MMLVIRYALATFLLLLLWWAGSAAMGPDLLPDPWATDAAFITALGDPDFIRHGVISLWRLVAGVGVAALAAFPLGLWLGHSRRADWLGAPVVFITFPLPKIVLLPVFFMLVGLGDASRLLLIGLTTGYQILVIVRDAALSLNPVYEQAYRSMGGKGWGLLRHVWLPAALPALMTSLKVAAGTAVAVLFLAESFATDSGLGWLIMDAWGMGDALRMFTGILGMSVLGLFLYGSVGVLERIFCRWQEA